MLPIHRLSSARRASAALTLGLALGLSACGTLRDAATSASTLGGLIKPYKIDVVQGNVITKEQVSALKTGMTRVEVRDVLGTPLLQSVFHANRWDYVFTFRRGGEAEQIRKMAVFFEGNNLARVEADEMPTEAEFVASLVVRPLTGKDRMMEASEDRLKAFDESNRKNAAAPTAAAVPATATPTAAPPANTYPPLEAVPGAAR